jgi:hypothetical protein
MLSDYGISICNRILSLVPAAYRGIIRNRLLVTPYDRGVPRCGFLVYGSDLTVSGAEPGERNILDANFLCDVSSGNWGVLRDSPEFPVCTECGYAGNTGDSFLTGYLGGTCARGGVDNMKIKIKSDQPSAVKQLSSENGTGLFTKCWKIIAWDIRTKLGLVSTKEIWDHETYGVFVKLAQGDRNDKN